MTALGSTGWGSNSNGWPSKWRWSKAHERLLLAATLIITTWWFFLRGESHFRESLQARLRFDGSWGRFMRVQDALELTNVTWKDFAYATYATDLDYLCNSVMMVEALWRLDAKAERLILHSDAWSYNSTELLKNGTETYTETARLLQRATDMYGAVLQPVPVQEVAFEGDGTWKDSFTKLLAFNQTQYKRVLALDSDSTILQPMDELFLLPRSPVAMPRAYWLEHEYFDAIALLTPSATSHERIQTAIANRAEDEWDMDIMNKVFGDSCMVIPHRDYALVTGEFRASNHMAYLGEEAEEWNAKNALKEAKFVHFSDWPLPKPWFESQKSWEIRPNCETGPNQEQDCTDRDVWEGLYADFRDRRKAVCGFDTLPRA